MTTTRTRIAEQPHDYSHRSVGMWIVAVTAALLALASLLAMTSTTTSASGDPVCPPPSAQLSAVQPGASSEFKCAALDETYLTDPSPTTVSEPVDGDVVQTPTGTTTLPGTAP